MSNYPTHGLTNNQYALLRATLEGRAVDVPTATYRSLERRGLVRATYVLTDAGINAALNIYLF